MYELRYSKKAMKFLLKQDIKNQKRIVGGIEKLPLGNIKKLKGFDAYRLRIGDFRILFDVDGKVIDIINIGNRGQIY